MRFLLILFVLLSVPTFAKSIFEKEISGHKISIPIPEAFEEYCDKDFDFWEYASISTDARSHLLACFYKPKDFGADKPATTFRLEIWKDATRDLIEPDRYPALLDFAQEVVKAGNKIIEEHNRVNLDSGDKDIKALEEASQKDINLSVTVGLLEEVKRGENFILYSSRSVIAKEGGSEVLEGYTFTCFIIHDKKILVLKGLSTDESGESYDSMRAKMIDWISGINS